MHHCLLFLLISIPIFTFGQKSTKNELKIEFIHTVDNQTLTLDTYRYFNPLGQDYTITKFKYYISDITLLNNNQNSSLSQDVFLINEEDPNSKKISIPKMKDGEYTHISFVLGVDSLRNCSGAQSGTLDPIHAMFWTWNTGYIFLKLEGKSSASSAPGNIFEYHIGGYKEPANCIQKINLKLKHPLVFSNPSVQSIFIQVNVAEILRQPMAIDFKTLPSVTDSRNAVLMSSNYKDMFSIR